MAPVDPALRIYVESAAAAPPVGELPLADVRAGMELEAAALWGAAADEVAEVRDLVVETEDGALPVRLYRPQSDASLPGLLWLHGGGWVVGSIDSHDHLCRAIAARTPCCVVSADYRLAPEHPFPAAVRDTWAALRWIRDSADELGIDLRWLAIGGDSAGGNLAAVTALRARDHGIPLALQVLVYPVIDAALDSESYRLHAAGLNLTREKMQWFWNAYLAGADPSHPDASPMRAADLSGVAPALVQIAEHDPLCSEGELYGRRLADAGVPAVVTRYDSMIHGFLRMPALTPTATGALEEICAMLAAPGDRGPRDAVAAPA
jgi:acetyl esterase